MPFLPKSGRVTDGMSCRPSGMTTAGHHGKSIVWKTTTTPLARVVHGINNDEFSKKLSGKLEPAQDLALGVCNNHNIRYRYQHFRTDTKSQAHCAWRNERTTGLTAKPADGTWKLPATVSSELFDMFPTVRVDSILWINTRFTISVRGISVFVSLCFIGFVAGRDKTGRIEEANH